MDPKQKRGITKLDLEGVRSTFLDSVGTRGFQDFLVTLPADPDFPFEISHNLKPALPTDVRYEVLQSTYPVTLYHSPRDAWGVGYVVLRATAGGRAQVRIRLTVDDTSAEPLLEGTGIDWEYSYDQETSFPFRVKARNRASDGGYSIGDFEAQLDATGISNGSSVAIGPGLDLKVTDDANNVFKGNNWQIFADGLQPNTSSHQRLLFRNKRDYNSVTDTTRFAMQLTRGHLSAAADTWFLCPDAGGNLNLGMPSAQWGGTGGYIASIYASGSIYERGRSTAMGEWASYTPSVYNMSNVVMSGAYTQIGKTVLFYILCTLTSTTVVSGIIGFSTPTAHSEAAISQSLAEAYAYDSSASGRYRLCTMISGSPQFYLYRLSEPLQGTSSTVPFTWADNDQIWINGYYLVP